MHNGLYALLSGTGRSSLAAGHKVRGDHNAKVKLSPTLAPDEVSYRYKGSNSSSSTGSCCSCSRGSSTILNCIC